MKYSTIIGRENEIISLERIYKSDKSEFAAIYGRRRVGKSYLVDEVFAGTIAFKAVGTYIKNDNYETYRQMQLEHFYDALKLSGLGDDSPKPTCWREAFVLLRKLLQGIRKKRKVVFIDELPWLAGPQSSEMIAELGYFWNSWADSQRNIVLVVCGSATSWMLDNIIHDYGGLHGRLTELIKLKPFTLAECEKYYRKHGFHLSRYEMAVGYMAFGGIPYYLDKLRNSMTLTDNIDTLFFANDVVNQEFSDVYAGLYSSKERYLEIVKALGKQFYGMSQADLVKATGISSGGTLTKMLDNLCESDIIRKYPRYKDGRVESAYQLKDFFSLFFLRFVDGKQPKAGQWNAIHRTATFYSWAGETFELLCIEHIPQIQKAIGIPSISDSFCWNGISPDGKGAQIDLVVECRDARTDYLCEMKFSESKFLISNSYEENILNKVSAFAASRLHKSSHSIQIVLVTTMGLSDGGHSGIANHSIKLDDLF